MSKELETVITFCLEHAEEAPVRQRVSLYRGLAEFCGSPELAAKFCSMADELEAAEKRFREFKFQLQEGQQIRRPKRDGHNGGKQ